MKKFKFDITAEKASTRILYVLVGLTALFFGAFYLIGFNRIWDEDPSFNDPVLTDVLLFFIFLLFLFAVAVGIWAMVRGLKISRDEHDFSSQSDTKGFSIHSPMFLSVAVTVLTFLSFIIFFIFGSSKKMTINGEAYNDTFWLKASDMFINTSILLLVIVVGAMIFGATRYNRKGGK